MEEHAVLKKYQDICIRNKLPLLHVDTSLAPCFLPHDLCTNNKIHINVHPTVSKDFKSDHEEVTVKVFFDGKCYVLRIPLIAIIGVDEYTQENDGA